MKVEVLGCWFDPFTLYQTVDAGFQMIVEGKRGWISTVNVSILMAMRTDRSLKDFIDRSSLVVADGQPLVWITSALAERVTGIDLVDAFCARAEQENVGVYLLGATDDISRRAAERLKFSYPALQIESSGGYFHRDETGQRVLTVNNSGAKILFVGMGVPRQERFIEENWKELGVSLAIGVGGSFDVIAGVRRRAPSWVQKVGMEWFFRFIQEPRRLGRRYVFSNSLFIYLLIRTKIRDIFQNMN